MATTSESSVSFEQTDTRSDEMNSTIEQWIDDLVAGVDDAQASAEFQEWLDVQSRFHDYSYRNTLLIKRQYPEATRVAGYRTWQEEFDRHVKEGESAIWIWAPIITKQCPECENSPSYHEDSDCPRIIDVLGIALVNLARPDWAVLANDVVDNPLMGGE